MPPDAGLYDLFVSYSTKDNVLPPGERQGWVHAFILRLRELAIPFTQQNITTTGDADAFPNWDTFYAPEGIEAGHLWEPRLRTAVAHSRVLLACLSPHYWQSTWCRIEWETYLENESARGLANQVGGITPIYFVEAPGVAAADIVAQAPEWARDLLSARQVRLLDFSQHGPDVLARLAALRGNAEAEARMASIASRVAQQISHARRAERGQVGNIALGTEQFVGRHAELQQVEQQLFGRGALGVITALRGIGGQGKTALALRYGQNLRSRYSGGCWQLAAEGAEALLPLLAALREPLHLAAVATEDAVGTAHRVLAELHRRAHDPDVARSAGQPAAVLLVLDNVDHAGVLARPQREALHMAMREAGTGTDPGWLHVLATTRLEARELSFLPQDQIIAVDALPEADALRLWLKISGPLNDAETEAARQIIAAVERHTLTVEVAARHIRRTTGETSVTYLARLRLALASGPSPLARLLSGQQEAIQASDLPGYAHPLAEALGFTFAHLAAEDPAAASVLHYAAHWPAEAVPLPWLRALAGAHHPELLEEPDAPGLPTAWDRAVLRLGESLRLLTPADTDQPQIARLHRLAGIYMRASAEQEGFDASRVMEVEQFIERRCAQAEHQHALQLRPWERHVLLADLPVRISKPDCSAEMAQDGLLLGGILIEYGNLAAAWRLIDAAHGAIQRLAAADPANAGWQRDLLVSHGKLGDVLSAQGNLPGALSAFLASLAIAESLAADDPGNAARQRDLSISSIKVGDMLKAQGNLAGALAAFQASHAIDERFVAPDPGNAIWQHGLSFSHNKLGEVLSEQGNLSGALAAFQGSLAIRERLAAADPGNANWQRNLSISHKKIGDVLLAQGNLSGALAAFQTGLAIGERLAAADPGNTNSQRDLAISLQRMGEINYRQGDMASAAEAFRESLRCFQTLSATSQTNVTLLVDAAEACELLAKSLDAESMEGRAERLALLEHGMDLRRQVEARMSLSWRQSKQLADLQRAFDDLNSRF